MRYDEGHRERVGVDDQAQTEGQALSPWSPRKPSFAARVITDLPPPETFFRVNPLVVGPIATGQPDYTGGVPALTEVPAVSGGLASEEIVFLLGTESPHAGDLVVVDWADHRWVTQLSPSDDSPPDGQLCVTIPSCFVFGSSDTALVVIKLGATVIDSRTVAVSTYTTPSYCVTITTAGSYTITVTPSGPSGLLTPSPRTVTAALGISTFVTIRLYPPTFQACVGVAGCPDPILGTHVEGATVEFKDHTGTTVGTCVTDFDGECCITVANDADTGPPPVPWTVTATPPGGSGYLPGSTSTTVGPMDDLAHGCGASFGIQLETDADHACFCNCRYPRPRRLEYVDANGASGILNWGTLPILGGDGWSACIGYTEAAGGVFNPAGGCCDPQEINTFLYVEIACEQKSCDNLYGTKTYYNAIKFNYRCGLDCAGGPPYRGLIGTPPAGNCSGDLRGLLWTFVTALLEYPCDADPFNVSARWEYLCLVPKLEGTETDFTLMDAT